MDLFADNILDHFKHPRGKRELSNADVSHTEKNPSCGDALSIQLKLHDGIVKEIGWTGQGCAVSQAAMSMLSEHIENKSTSDLMNLSENDIRTLLGIDVGTRRLKCMLLCLHTLKNTLLAAEGKEGQSWQETVGNKQISG